VTWRMGRRWNEPFVVEVRGLPVTRAQQVGLVILAALCAAYVVVRIVL
jgi:hypothetical protein